MSLPDDVLSTSWIPAPFIGGRAFPCTNILDHTDGPKAIQDTSGGMQYQRWRAALIGDDIWLEASEISPFVIFSGSDITEISLAFDQNARQLIAFVQEGLPKLWWYNSIISSYEIADLDPTIINPRLSLDDKRDWQTAHSDVILGYIREGVLYWRQQRDRFLIEYFGAAGPYPGLIKMGMNRKWRFQFAVKPG